MKPLQKKKILKYREYYQKHFGKVSASEILFGWFDYCAKHGIKDTRNADKEIDYLNSKQR